MKRLYRSAFINIIPIYTIVSWLKVGFPKPRKKMRKDRNKAGKSLTIQKIAFLVIETLAADFSHNMMNHITLAGMFMTMRMKKCYKKYNRMSSGI